MWERTCELKKGDGRTAIFLMFDRDDLDFLCHTRKLQSSRSWFLGLPAPLNLCYQFSLGYVSTGFSGERDIIWSVLRPNISTQSWEVKSISIWVIDWVGHLPTLHHKHPLLVPSGLTALKVWPPHSSEGFSRGSLPSPVPWVLSLLWLSAPNGRWCCWQLPCS